MRLLVHDGLVNVLGKPASGRHEQRCRHQRDDGDSDECLFSNFADDTGAFAGLCQKERELPDGRDREGQRGSTSA
jgi:hypothetical protein